MDDRALKSSSVRQVMTFGFIIVAYGAWCATMYPLGQFIKLVAHADKLRKAAHYRGGTKHGGTAPIPAGEIREPAVSTGAEVQPIPRDQARALERSVADVRMLTHTLARIANLDIRSGRSLVEQGDWKEVVAELQSIAQDARSQISDSAGSFARRSSDSQSGLKASDLVEVPAEQSI